MSIRERPPLLSIDAVTVVRSERSGAVRILDNISLSIDQGQHTVILGANGAGKSSLLKLLSRQFYPSVDDDTVGTVQILGRRDWHVDELRRQIGIVSGEMDREFSLPRSGRMTGLQAVLSGFDGVQLVSFTRQDDAQRRLAAARALQQVDADHLRDRTVGTMSTGERRRVLIARALVYQPAALVLDEPTTGLDIAASHSFLATVRRLAAGGVTIVLVTHHVEEIIPEIRHAILLSGGTVTAAGDCQSMLTGERLSELFGVPVTVSRSASGRWSAEVCQPAELPAADAGKGVGSPDSACLR